MLTKGLIASKKGEGFTSRFESPSFLADFLLHGMAWYSPDVCVLTLRYLQIKI